MHFTVFKNDLPHDNSTDWLDIDLEEIISKAIGKKLTSYNIAQHLKYSLFPRPGLKLSILQTGSYRN